MLRPWTLFGLRCWLKLCPGKVDWDSHGVYWECTDCRRRDYANGWDYLPPDGPARGPRE